MQAIKNGDKYALWVYLCMFLSESSIWYDVDTISVGIYCHKLKGQTCRKQRYTDRLGLGGGVLVLVCVWGLVVTHWQLLKSHFEFELGGSDTFFLCLFCFEFALEDFPPSCHRGAAPAAWRSGVFRWEGREERASSLILCHGKTSLGCFRRTARSSAPGGEGSSGKLRGDYVSGTQGRGESSYTDCWSLSEECMEGCVRKVSS